MPVVTDTNGRKRVLNDFGQRVHICTACELWKLYLRARDQGLGIKMAARYALHSVKGMAWHSHRISQTPGRDVHDKRFKWPRTSKLNLSYQRLVKLINSARHTEYTIHDLDNEQQFMDYMTSYLHSGGRYVHGQRVLVQPFTDKELQGAENYKAITGIELKMYELLDSSSERRGLKQWAAVNRGRDLFIPGVGSFDIAGTIRDKMHVNIEDELELYTASSYSCGQSVMLPSVLQNQGYGLERYMLDVLMYDAMPPARRVLRPARDIMDDSQVVNMDKVHLWATYLRRWIREIRTDERCQAGMWDLAEMYYHPEDFEFKLADNLGVHPADLTARVQEVRAIAAQAEEQRQRMASEQHYNLMRRYDYDRWVDIQVAHNLPEECEWPAKVYEKSEYMQTNGSILTVHAIATRKELRAVGERLKNCAAMYWTNIIRGTDIFLVLKNASGKPLALCRKNFDNDIIEVRETCNKQCRDAYVALLDEQKVEWVVEDVSVWAAIAEYIRKEYPPLEQNYGKMPTTNCADNVLAGAGAAV